MVPSGRMGTEKLAEIILGRGFGADAGGRAAGADKGSAGESKSVAASESDNAGVSNIVAESESDRAGVSNIVAASESEGCRKIEESIPEGGVCTAFLTSLFRASFSGDFGRDSGDWLESLGSRDGSLGVSNRHLYIGPHGNGNEAKFTPNLRQEQRCRLQGAASAPAGAAGGFNQYIRGSAEGLDKLGGKSAVRSTQAGSKLTAARAP